MKNWRVSALRPITQATSLDFLNRTLLTFKWPNPDRGILIIMNYQNSRTNSILPSSHHSPSLDIRLARVCILDPGSSIVCFFSSCYLFFKLGLFWHFCENPCAFTTHMRKNLSDGRSMHIMSANKSALSSTGFQKSIRIKLFSFSVF